MGVHTRAVIAALLLGAPAMGCAAWQIVTSESGKRVEVEDIRPAYAALTVIERSLARYQQERDRLMGKLVAK